MVLIGIIFRIHANINQIVRLNNILMFLNDCKFEKLIEIVNL